MDEETRSILSEIEAGAQDRAALERLVGALRAALDAGAGLAIDEELSRAPAEGAVARWTSLAIALSAVEPDDLDALDRARRGALALAERAATWTGGPAMVVRVARLREELGLPGAEAAWAEAARREPLIAWAYPELTAGGDAHVAVGLLRSLADSSSRARALASLERVAAADDAPDGALAALALERVAELAAEPAPDLGAIRGLASRVANPALRAVLEACAAVLEGELELAAASLATIEALSEPGSARAIADAMRAALRSGGAPDVRALLREAWLEAMIDPVVALALPRSALAKLRTALVVLSITSAASMAFTSTAQAQDPEPEQPRTEQTESRDGGGGQQDPWSRDVPPSSAWARS